MLRRRTRVKNHGLLDRAATAIVAILILHQSFVCSSSEPDHPTSQRRSIPIPKSGLDVNSTNPQNSHYLKNTFLRPDLRENQTGLPLSIQVTILDSHSCTPVENALVEIWGANSRGAYSGEFTSTDPSKFECSSWLRGGLSTDSEGVVKFETVYPGPEFKRAPHLNAIIRTDWYENGNNKTVDSDSTPFAAAIGQIFFPQAMNEQVYKDPNYRDSSTKAVKNQADPSYNAQSSSWKAETEAYTGGSNQEIRAHLTISINISEPAKVRVESGPYQCGFGKEKPSNTTPTGQGSNEDSSSAASFTRPSTIFFAFLNMMMLYTMYGHGSFSRKKHCCKLELQKI